MSLASPLSRSLNRRRLFAAGGVLGAGAVLAACSNDDPAESGGSWTFTDARGETVELDGAPDSVVAFVGLAAALYDYGVEIKTVFGPTTLEDGSPDLQAGRLPVGELDVIGNAWGEFDLERYAAAEPDVLVSHYHEGFPLWYVPEESVDQVEALAPTIGLAVADLPLDEAIAGHVRLAEALGADVESEAAVAGRERYDAAVEAVREAAAANPVKVLACNGYPDFFYVANPVQFDVLDLCTELGVDIVVPEEPEDGGYWEPLSWENADYYDADLVLLDERTGNLQADELADQPTWNSISAVRAGQVTPWNPEPIYSHVGAAEILESIARAVAEADAVTSG